MMKKICVADKTTALMLRLKCATGKIPYQSTIEDLLIAFFKRCKSYDL